MRPGPITSLCAPDLRDASFQLVSVDMNGITLDFHGSFDSEAQADLAFAGELELLQDYAEEPFKLQILEGGKVIQERTL